GRLNVSITEPIGGHGGLEFYDLGLCEALSSQNIDVSLYTCDKTKLHLEYEHSYSVLTPYKKVFGPTNRIFRGIRYIRGTLSAVFDSLRRRSTIAHFHIFSFSLLEYLNILIFKIFRFRIVATIHDVESLAGIEGSKSKKKYYKFSNIIDHIVVHNSFTKAEVIKRNPFYDPEKIHVIPPTDLDFLFNEDISRSDAREALGFELPEDSRIILFFGQIKKTKGLDILIKAFAQLKEKNVFLVIAGRCWKTDMDKYHSLINSLKIKNKTIIEEKYIKNRDVMRLFKAADVVVLPYIKVYNSSVLLRGMDYGAVNVVSDLSFFTEVIKDGSNGLIFKSGDIKELRSVLSVILNDKKLLKRIGENSKKFVQQNYSFDVIGEQVRSVYDRLEKAKL
ncbi:MAG: glycosyltransferase family 4 protein, partial [Candidatus Aminicenantes bacterium]|nr:glycosyltransferase family 4 protein [Candidatus Aminicenantes bacterium]